MFGIIDKNKKFILIDENRETLRNTALMLSINYNFGPMFQEDNIDDVIQEYTKADIETGYDGDTYIKGFAPVINNDYQSRQRAKMYVAEIDQITAHIQRLRDEEPESAKIAELMKERAEKVAKIKEKYPYAE